MEKMSRTIVVIAGLCLIALAQAGPIQNSATSTSSNSTNSTTSSNSQSKQSSSSTKPSRSQTSQVDQMQQLLQQQQQQQQHPPPVPFGVNLMTNQLRVPITQGLPTMPQMFPEAQGFGAPQFPMPPIMGFSQAPQPNSNSSANFTTSPGRNMTNPEVQKPSAGLTPSRQPFHEAPMGNDQMMPNGPSFIKETTPMMNPMMSGPMPMPMPMPMPLAMQGPMPVSFMFGMPMMVPPFGRGPGDVNMADTNPMVVPLNPMWNPMFGSMWNPWMVSAMSSWQFPPNGFPMQNFQDSQG